MANRNKVPTEASAPLTGARKHKYDEERMMEERERNRPKLERRDPRKAPIEAQRTSLAESLISKLPSESNRDFARMITHGIARTGNTILRTLDIPNRIFGNTRSLLQDIYEKSEANLARDKYEDQNVVNQVGETAVHLASTGVLGKALPAVFGANTGVDMYETAKYAGASEGEALAKSLGHGAIDTAIWTLGQGLASRYLPKAWQWLGREIIGAGRGAASSVTTDAVLNSLGADISGEEMAKRAVHAAWMVPLLGMLKMGGKRREDAMALIRKARPDLAGKKADNVIEMIETEFSDPKSQKIALAWVARKGANLPDDTAQIKQALEVVSKVKGFDPMSRSPFEILSNPAYARYLPKPKPQDVKAFSNMKRYPMGVIGFDVSDDAAGRQATREMINAYMSPSSNPWCLATGKGAAKLGELGPSAEGYWNRHSAVPKQIFFQEVDGKLELTAFRATSQGGEERQEYWDTSDAGYSGIPLKVKVPGDPMGRYQKMVFRPAENDQRLREKHVGVHDYVVIEPPGERPFVATIEDARGRLAGFRSLLSEYRAHPEDYRPGALQDVERIVNALERAVSAYDARPKAVASDGEIQGTFEDIAPGNVFKGDPFRDGKSQMWVRKDSRLRELDAMGRGADYYGEDTAGIERAYKEEKLRLAKPGHLDDYVLVEDKVRTTENGITKFRTTKYADPTGPDLGLYEGDENLKVGQPVEIEESELVSPEWMRSRGYDPESEVDVRRMQQELHIQAWGNGMEAAMAVVPTKRTYMQTKSGTPETVTYGPKGRGIRAVDFTKDGVPYREEYFPSGPSGALLPTELYDTVTPGELPAPSGGYWNSSVAPAGRRLIRNPDSGVAEVLNEISWDDSLGGYTRIAGNRRWRVVPTTGEYLKTAARDFVLGPWSVMLGKKLPPADRLRVEDRQPDGTWMIVKEREIPPKPNDTPFDPDDIPFDPDDSPFALKAGRTRRDIRAAEGAGDTVGPDDVPVETPTEAPTEAPVGGGGPRIVINPEVFEDKRDALCVAMNEAFRVLMEMNGFNPVSEPTEAQRQFFADTAYNQNENQMRRTILARICTFDTSVKDPTEEQLAESVEFLETVMEMGAPQNQWEQQAVQRIHDVLVAALEQGTVPGGEASAEEAPVDNLEGDERQEQAAVGGGQAFGGINDEEDKEMKRQADEMKAEGLTSVNEDTSTLEEREAYLRERGMDTDLAQYGSMSSLVKLHEQEVNGTYGDPKAAALEAANKEDAAEFVKFNDPSRELTENEKDAAEFVKFNDPGRGETTEKGPNPALGVNDNGDANEFVKNAEEPAGPTRIRGHFRDEDGRVISQRTAQKLWDEAHNRSKDVTEVVKNTEELRPGGGQNVASTTAWDYRQKNGSGRQLTREEQEQHERTASTAAWAERTGNVNQVEDDEFKV